MQRLRFASTAVNDRDSSALVLLETLDRRHVLPVRSSKADTSTLETLLNEQTKLGCDPSSTLAGTEERGSEVERVCLLDVGEDGVSQASVTIAAEREETDLVMRPTAALAVAARTGAPIYATDRVMRKAAIPVGGQHKRDLIAAFQDFLETVTAEDFDSYGRS